MTADQSQQPKPRAANFNRRSLETMTDRDLCRNPKEVRILLEEVLRLRDAKIDQGLKIYDLEAKLKKAEQSAAEWEEKFQYQVQTNLEWERKQILLERAIQEDKVNQRHFDILVKATNDGSSDQPISDIVTGCLQEIKELYGDRHSGGWLPIQSAPKDGTIIDLLTRLGVRIPDVRWVVEDRTKLQHPELAMDGWKDLKSKNPYSVMSEGQFTHWRYRPALPVQSKDSETNG